MTSTTLIAALDSSSTGIVQHFPTSAPWSKAIPAQIFDRELRARYGNLPASRLTRSYMAGGRLDTRGLSAHLWARYSHNWNRIWAALQYEYVIDETKSSSQSRTTTRELTQGEVEKRKQRSTDEVRGTTSGRDRSSRSGSDQENRDLSNGRDITSRTSETTGGNASSSTGQKMTGWETGSASSSGSKADSTWENDKNWNSEDGSEGRVKTWGETTNDRSDGNSTTTVNGGGTERGSSEKFDGGVGGPAPILAERETHNSDSTSNSTTTGNEGKSASSSRDGSEDENTNSSRASNGGYSRSGGVEGSSTENSKSSTDRQEVNNTTTSENSSSATNSTGNEGERGFDRGRVTSSSTGTEETTRSDTIHRGQEGTATEDASTDTTLRETITDEYNERGSSALGSFQDAINDELAGRRGQAWNFVSIIVDDLREVLAGRVYFPDQYELKLTW